MCCESVAAWSWAPDILQVRGLCGGVGLILLVCVEGATITFDTGFETGELAVGGALGAAGHPAAGGEPCEGFAHAQGFGRVASFVDGGQPFVRIAADEAHRDALLEEVDGPAGVACLEGALRFLVALHRGFEVEERFGLGAYLLPFLFPEAVKGRRWAVPPLRTPIHALQTPENHTTNYGYTQTSIYEHVGWMAFSPC